MTPVAKKAAFSLVELLLSLVLGTMILFALYQLLAGSMRTSVKGSAHLTNVQASATFIRQVVRDIPRAVDFSRMIPDTDQPAAAFDMLEEQETGGLATYSVTYEVAPDGLGIVRRCTPRPGAALPDETQTFCRGLKIVDCRFRFSNLIPEGAVFSVVLKAGTPPDGKEEFAIKRFILCRNHASNSALLRW